MIEQLQEMEVARQEMKRKAFEEAFQDKLGAHICQFDLDDDGNYEDRETLSGWEMWQAAQEQMLREQAEEAAQPNAFLSAVADMTMKLSSGDYALVPKKEVCDFYVANHLKGTTCSVDVSNLTGNDGDRIYGKLFDYDCIGSDGNTLIYALESSNFKLAKNKGNSGDYVLVKKSTIQAIHQSCENALDMAAVWAKDAALCTIRDEVELLQK